MGVSKILVVYHHQGRGLRVVVAEHGGQVEDVGPGDLPQPGVSHGDIEPVVSARPRLRGEAGQAAGARGGHDTDQGDTDQHQAQEHCAEIQNWVAGCSNAKLERGDNILFLQLMY